MITRQKHQAVPKAAPPIVDDGLGLPDFLNRKLWPKRVKWNAPVRASSLPGSAVPVTEPYYRILFPQSDQDKEVIKGFQLLAEGKLKAKQERPSEPKKERAPSFTREKRKGLIDMASIAKDLKITAKIARGLLRSIKFPKPQHGWAFTIEQCKDVKQAILKAQEKQENAKQKRIRPTKVSSPKASVERKIPGKVARSNRGKAKVGKGKSPSKKGRKA
jgi:hypothetical protein